MRSVFYEKNYLIYFTVAFLLSISLSATVHAETSTKEDNMLKNNKLTLKEIGGSWSGELHGGMGTKPVVIGNWNKISDNPYFLMLDVVNGGPLSLNWSAAIYNVSKNKVICDWTNFNHNYSNLTLRYKEKPSNGDQLQLWLHANSGSGVVYVRY